MIQLKENKGDTNKERDYPSYLEERKSKINYEEELITKSLAKVGKGTGIILIGTILGMIFNLFRGLIIIWFYTPTEYGLFNFYITILSIFTIIGSIGLSEGIQRNLSYYIGKAEKRKAKAVVVWGLGIGTIGGLISGIVLFLFSNPLASLLSADPRLASYFKAVSIILPFYILTTVLISIFRGFQRTKEVIVFQQIILNSLILILIIIVTFFTLPFQNIIYSVSFAILINFLIFLIYFLKKKDKLNLSGNNKWDFAIGKKLLFFSLPMLFVIIMNNIMQWADIIIIGYYLPDSSIGFYQSALMICNFISMGLTASIFIYTPLVTTLYAQNRVEINKTIYIIITKWLCFLTLPLTLTFFLYSGDIINLLYGGEYINAIIPLQILVIIYFYDNLMGPNGATLTAYGKTKSLIYATGFAGLLNIILNVLLIPIFGIIGAAIGTFFSIFSINLIRAIILKKISGIHSITPKILKPICLTILFSVLLYYSFQFFFTTSIFLVIISALLFYFIFFLSLILTKSISKEDINLILLIEKQLGLNLKTLKRLFKKFI